MMKDWVGEGATPDVTFKASSELNTFGLCGLSGNRESGCRSVFVGACLRHLAPDGKGSKIPPCSPVDFRPGIVGIDQI